MVNWENTLKTHGSKHGKHIYTVNIHLYIYIYMIDIPVKKIWHKQQTQNIYHCLLLLTHLDPDTLGPYFFWKPMLRGVFWFWGETKQPIVSTHRVLLLLEPLEVVEALVEQPG